jgi:hypothetical protein
MRLSPSFPIEKVLEVETTIVYTIYIKYKGERNLTHITLSYFLYFVIPKNKKILCPTFV